MAHLEVNPIEDKQTWENFLGSRPEANFLHSWNWGEFHHQLGHTIHRVGYWKNFKLQGVMLSIVERAKRGRYLIVPGGPLINWNDAATVKLFVDSLKHLALSNKCSFVRVRPQLLETLENAHLFTHLGFHHAPMHLHAELTHQLDLSPTEEQLLANMRKATRYEIRRVEKLGIKIVVSTNPEDIDAFYHLQIQTAQRQEFVAFGKKYLEEQFAVFATDNQALLYTATLEKKILAQALIIFYGQEADYHYGASSEMGRKFPGAYAIQWAAIKEAKKLGLRRYNFWGVAPADQPHHRFYGVSVFKRGFHGEDMEYLHARDLIIDPVRYALNWTVETMRKRFRHL